MNIIKSYTFTDYQELSDYFLLEGIKQICDFDSINEPYLISINAKAFSYSNRTITYDIDILSLD